MSKTTIFGLFKKPDNTFEERPIQVDDDGKLLTSGTSTSGGGASAEDIGDAVNRPKNTFTGTMQTSSTGSQAVRLPSNLASEVTVHNRTGVQLAWQYVVDNVPVGQLIRIDPGMAATIPVMGNSDLVALRRFDQSNSQVTVNFEGVLM